MELTKIKSLLMLPVLMLALAGCGSSSDTDTDNTVDNTCTPVTETVQYTTLPEITYADVEETLADHSSKATAQDLQSSNVIISGEGFYPSLGACDGCDDYYALSVSAGDELDMELSTAQGMTTFIYLYENDDANTNTFVDSADSVKRLSYTVPTGVTDLYIYVYTTLTNAQTTGEYTLKITTPVEPEALTDTITSGCTAGLQGALTDAVNGSVVEGATLNLREGSGVKTGTVDYSVTSDAQGQYSFTDINAGEYTIEIVKADYITHYLDIALADDKTAEKKFQLSPTLAAGEELRLVMSWGAQPYILDSYLNGPNGSGGSFTVKYYERTGTGVSLDRDATNGYGPETMTFTQFNEGTYTYWINDYTNRSNSSSTALGVSGANVTVYDASGIVKQYKVPSGTGTKWNVLTITVNGSGDYTINDVNTLGNWSESP